MFTAIESNKKSAEILEDEVSILCDLIRVETVAAVLTHGL
jgi:hypothetical protein